MKTLLIIFAAFVVSRPAGAQGTVVPGGGVVVTDYAKPPTFLRELFRDGITPKLYADISGTPFLFDNFLLARLTFMDDRVADSALIKLNIYDNKIHFIDEKGEEMQVRVPVKEILITDDNPSWHGNVYRTGYAGGGSSFYQVLADGKNMQLLKRVMMKVWQTRALGDQDKKSFQYEDELYFANENNVYPGSKKCNAIIEAAPEKYREQLVQFSNTNSARCNKEADMKKLVDYCNTL